MPTLLNSKCLGANFEGLTTSHWSRCVIWASRYWHLWAFFDWATGLRKSIGYYGYKSAQDINNRIACIEFRLCTESVPLKEPMDRECFVNWSVFHKDKTLWLVYLINETLWNYEIQSDALHRFLLATCTTVRKRRSSEIQLLKPRSQVNQVHLLSWAAVEIAEELVQLRPWYVHEAAENGHQPGQRRVRTHLPSKASDKMIHDRLSSTKAPSARDKFLLWSHTFL